VSSPPRTVDDFAAPYANFLVRVPAAGTGVCKVCHSIVSGFDVCYQCYQARSVIGSAMADVAAFVSMAPTGEQFARELYTYKNPSVGSLDRQLKTVGLAAVLWKWLGLHEACMTRRIGLPSPFDLVTTVPSTSGRPAHPLRTVVAGIVVGSDSRHADLLAIARTDLEQRAQAPDRYRATAGLWGKSVLVIDDTWTTGAHAQSASAALKAVGAAKVGVLAIGRWFDRTWNPGAANGESWLAEHRKPGWAWERCCLDPD